MSETFLVNSGNVAPLSVVNPPSVVPVGLRRKEKNTIPEPKLKIDRILGLTSTSSNMMDAAQDLVAYAAGAVVILYHPKKNKQTGFLYPPPTPSDPPNPIPSVPGQTNGNDLHPTEEKQKSVSVRAKTVSCLAFTSDGNYLAVGEAGHQPRIFIWDVREKKIYRELRAHKFGVFALAFSPNMKYLVSVGFQHDGYLYVWDWKKGAQLAGNKVTSRVNALAFSKDGSFFVTAGLRHVKFWYLDPKGRMLRKGPLSETQVMDGRAALLGVLRDANFVDVACDQSSGYFITDAGILCTFKEGRVIDKWVDLQVKQSFSVDVSSRFVVCTCSEGIIRLFEPVSLKYVGILPKPHPLGIDISSVTAPGLTDETSVYPDSVSIVYDAKVERVTTVYSDRSLYIWDIHDLKKIGKYRSFIFHSDCVWGVEACPNTSKNTWIPFNTFATFSGDGTIRLWNLDRPVDTSASSSNKRMVPSSSTMVSPQRRNIYSRELVKMLYVDNAAAEFIQKVRNLDRVAEEAYPDFGIRSLRMSPDGQWMASGDRNGNLRVHDMQHWRQWSYQEAHESEILSMDITGGASPWIATGSRDRLLHVFELRSEECRLIQSLDDHSSSITAVRFTGGGQALISSGADKGVIFRRRTGQTYTSYQNNAGRSTVFGMALDTRDRCVATVTGERKVHLFDVDTGRAFRVCRPDAADEPSGGSLINIDLDPFSATFAVTSGSDRSLRLLDLTNNLCLEKVNAHAEQITAVKFVRTNREPNGLRIVTTCADSTIFVWKISPDIVAKMNARAGLAPEERNKARIRRVTHLLQPSLSHTTRKTFSGVSSAEQKYDDVYAKFEGGKRRPAAKPSARRPTRATPPLKRVPDKESDPKTVLAKRRSQPVLGTAPARLTDTSEPIEKEEEEEESEEEEEQIIFTPEPENKPFKVSTHTQAGNEEADWEERPAEAWDTPEEEESTSEDEVKNITSLAPPRVTASRSIIRRSRPRQRRSKRESFTAKFLSSLPDLLPIPQPESVDSGLDGVLPDLDGACILLDSVLSTVYATRTTPENQNTLAEIRKRLTGLADRLEPHSSRSEVLLEKYSDLLLNMVQTKIER